AHAGAVRDDIRVLHTRPAGHVSRGRNVHDPRRRARGSRDRSHVMLMLKIAARNLFRNTRRSVTTLGTITIGAAAGMVFGAYITYIHSGFQPTAVKQTGLLQVFRNGYFPFGPASPGAWGIDHYSTVLSLIRNDQTLQRLSAVVTPIQSLAGIAGNFENNTSKTFFGVGFVPSERDRM